MAGDGHAGGMDGGMPMSPPSTSPSLATPAAMAPEASQMHMTFFWGKDVQILFSGWPGSRPGVDAYLLALFFVFALSLLVESLSYAARRLTSLDRPSIATGLAQTTVHAIRVGLAYLVMLAVMSFNIGVLVAAIAGHALGFFIFGSGAFGWGANDGSNTEHKH